MVVFVECSINSLYSIVADINSDGRIGASENVQAVIGILRRDMLASIASGESSDKSIALNAVSSEEAALQNFDLVRKEALSLGVIFEELSANDASLVASVAVQMMKAVDDAAEHGGLITRMKARAALSLEAEILNHQIASRGKNCR